MREYFKVNNQFKKYLPIFLIMLSVIVLMGTSYALLRSSQQGEQAYVMNVGLLEVTFQDSETNALSVTDMVPVTDEEGIQIEKELVFTVKNTGSLSALYNVYVEETSTNPAFKTVIKFISNKNDTGYNDPKTLSEDNYIDEQAYLDVSETATYKVKFWLAESADATYMNKTFTARIVVDVMQTPKKKTGADTIIEQTGTNGIVAINADGELYDASDTTQTVDSYRYSGTDVKNYVYFNCNDTDGTYNHGDENYDYANNCETWRIIGTFKNSAGEWNLKLMRNTILTADELPSSYTMNGTTYTLEEGTTGRAYWNNPATLKSTNYNDWTTGGLQYFLNTEKDESATPVAGYYSTITDNAKALIDENYTYNLGNVYYDSTTLVAKAAEEGTVECASTVTSDTHSNSCNIWNGNKPTWTGAVALMYPSDYGYSASSTYWSATTLYNYNLAAASTSWMQTTANHSYHEWLLSPSSINSYYAMRWYTSGYVYHDYVYYYGGARPVVNLISSAKLSIGDGTSEKPYVVIGE